MNNHSSISISGFSTPFSQGTSSPPGSSPGPDELSSNPTTYPPASSQAGLSSSQGFASSSVATSNTLIPSSSAHLNITFIPQAPNSSGTPSSSSFSVSTSPLDSTTPSQVPNTFSSGYPPSFNVTPPASSTSGQPLTSLSSLLESTSPSRSSYVNVTFTQMQPVQSRHHHPM